MALVCKWRTVCSRCGDPIEEGDDLWLVESLADAEGENLQDVRQS